MKNIKKFFTVFILLSAIITSCSKDYLETRPSDQIPDTELLKTIDGVRILLNGVYGGLYRQYSDQEEDGQGAMMINLDFLGEDIVHSATGSSYFRNTYRWIGHVSEINDVTYFTYRFYFTIIANTNLILDNLDNVNATEKEKKTIRGECLAIRAWSHFYLVQLFGKRYNAATKPNVDLGVPILTKYSSGPQPRATVEEVYEQINDDLDNSILLLKDAQPRIYKTHINLSVAKGIKARVALTQQNWEDAAKYASEARAGFGLMSNADYLSGFNNLGNSEWMWGANQLADQLPSYGSFFSYMSANYNSVHTRTNPKLINSFLWNSMPATDIRKKLWWDGTKEDEVNFPGVINAIDNKPITDQLKFKYMHRKFLVKNPGVSSGDIPFMRMAEMYLIEAEALARIGLTIPATTALKALVVNRDPAYNYTITTQDALINEIIRHRRIELWGEGFRFTDLKRTNTGLNRNDTGAKSALANFMSISAGNYRWQFMIPRRELQANPFMIQNPGQ